MRRLSLMVTEPLFEQIELARGDVARERWLRRAVERALGGGDAVASPPAPVGAEKDVVQPPTPAEQPESEGVMEFDDRGRMSRFEGTYAPREFRPYPKGGKR